MPTGRGGADFGESCATCPLRDRCTTSASGRSVTIHRREEVLQRHKAAQADPAWQAEYRSTRPKVERKIAHFVRVVWGGRKARVRGKARISTDLDPRAAALNWARLANLGLCRGRRPLGRRPTVIDATESAVDLSPPAPPS